MIREILKMGDERLLRIAPPTLARNRARERARRAVRRAAEWQEN